MIIARSSLSSKTTLKSSNTSTESLIVSFGITVGSIVWFTSTIKNARTIQCVLQFNKYKIYDYDTNNETIFF